MSGNTQAGASTATSETKNNEYSKKEAEQWYFIGEFIKNFDFSNWQYGDIIFAYQVGEGAADLIGAQGGMIITLDKVFFSVGVQSGFSAFASDGSGNKLYVLKPKFGIIDFIKNRGTLERDYFVTDPEEFDKVMKGVSMGVSASVGLNFSYSTTPDNYTVLSFGTGFNVGIGGIYSITW